MTKPWTMTEPQLTLLPACFEAILGEGGLGMRLLICLSHFLLIHWCPVQLLEALLHTLLQHRPIIALGGGGGGGGGGYN